MLAPMLLDPHPGESVPDLAAAPGGKTLQMAAMMDNRGMLSAVEPVKRRFFRLRANLERGGATMVRCYLKDGRSVGVKVLKNKLSEYIRLASGGETVLVTDHDRVVAELGPPRAGRAPTLADALLAEAVREGWLSPPVLIPEGPPARKPVAPWDEIQPELGDDREDE